jgi:hypothetical protein
LSLPLVESGKTAQCPTSPSAAIAGTTSPSIAVVALDYRGVDAIGVRSAGDGMAGEH